MPQRVSAVGPSLRWHVAQRFLAGPRIFAFADDVAMALLGAALQLPVVPRRMAAVTPLQHACVFCTVMCSFVPATTLMHEVDVVGCLLGWWIPSSLPDRGGRAMGGGFRIDMVDAESRLRAAICSTISQSDVLRSAWARVDDAIDGGDAALVAKRDRGVDYVWCARGSLVVGLRREFLEHSSSLAATARNAVCSLWCAPSRGEV